MNLHKLILFICILLCLGSVAAVAQKQDSGKGNNTLFTAGHAAAFIGGLYDGFYPYGELKKHGNFGLGAPDKLDGELLMLNGKIYQTQASGKTFEVKDTELTPLAIVNKFEADTVLKVATPMTRQQLYAYLDSVLPKQNNLYGIHIKGLFNTVQTRAFPAVKQKPYVPLASMLSLQHFFKFNNINGDMVGYRAPAYMEGPNISGYHFHFLSADKKNGGHIIDLLTGSITIEINYLDSFTVSLPQTIDFTSFDFKKDRTEEIKRVENGKN